MGEDTITSLGSEGRPMMTTRSSRATRLTTALGIAVLAAALTGCGGGTSPQSTSEPDPPTTPVTPTPQTPVPETSPPETANPSDLSTWIVTETSMGPIELDADFDAALELVPEWTTDENCSWTAFWNDPDAGLTAYFAHDSETEGGPITTIDVSAPDATDPAAGPHTDQGVGLGSSMDEVTAAYPDAEEKAATIGGATLLRVGDRDTAMYFTFAEGQQTVSSITVTAAEEPPYEVCG